jgi:hypothetical protein
MLTCGAPPHTLKQALLPVIRDSLDLNRMDVGNAGIAAVIGAVASRVFMGNMVRVPWLQCVVPLLYSSPCSCSCQLVCCRHRLPLAQT